MGYPGSLISCTDGPIEYCNYICVGENCNCGGAGNNADEYCKSGSPGKECCHFSFLESGTCESCSNMECTSNDDCISLYGGAKGCCQFHFLKGGHCESCFHMECTNTPHCKNLYPEMDMCCVYDCDEPEICGWDIYLDRIMHCQLCSTVYKYGEHGRRYMYPGSSHQGYWNMDMNMFGNDDIAVAQLLLIFVYFIIAIVCLGIG
eukprot:252980_1